MDGVAGWARRDVLGVFAWQSEKSRGMALDWLWIFFFCWIDRFALFLHGVEFWVVISEIGFPREK